MHDVKKTQYAYIKHTIGKTNAKMPVLTKPGYKTVASAGGKPKNTISRQNVNNVNIAHQNPKNTPNAAGKTAICYLQGFSL